MNLEKYKLDIEIFNLVQSSDKVRVKNYIKIPKRSEALYVTKYNKL